jgi:hypothetical protein
LLESPEATYVVEWSEVTGARTTKTYIAEAREKHAEMHTFIYAPRKVRTFLFMSPATCRRPMTPPQNGWQYIGQQRWSLIEIKPIWHSLIVPVPLLLFFLCGGAEADALQAQRALAGRRSHDADIVEITRGLKKGQLEQITVELVQVSILGPNAAETAVMKKLYD